MLRLLAILLVTLPALAGDYVDGFEDDLNADGLPDGWYRYSDNRTHPLYNPIELVEDAAHVREAKHAVRLGTLGGNVALVSAVPSPLLARVDPRKGYSFSVWAMTEGLAASRAFATIQWLDRLGAPLAPPQKTDAIGGNFPWTPLEARFETIPAQAHFVRFGLNIEGSDLSGAAWFDDLVWREEIRIRVEDLARRGFVVREGQTARIQAACEDLEVGEYELALWAHEYDGRDVPLALVASEEGRVLRVGTQGEARHAVRVGGSRRFEEEYRIEGVPTGFLDLVLSLRRDGEEVARRRVGFVSPPDRFLSRGIQSHWGVEVKPDTAPEIADRLAALRLGHARVLFWTGSPEREAELARTRAIDDLLYRLTRSGLTVSGSLSVPPPELLSAGTAQAGMAQFLSGPKSAWGPALRETFKRYRETIQEWRLGGTDDRGYEGSNGLDGTARVIVGAFSAELPNVGVTFPLPIGDAPNGMAQLAATQAFRGIDFYVPGDLGTPEAQALFAQVARHADRASVTIGLVELAAGEATKSFPAQAAALWRLAGIAMHEKVWRISVTPLVSPRAGLFDLEGTPTPLQGALWTILNALGDMEPLDLAGRKPIVDPPEEGRIPREIEQLVFRNTTRKETSILAWLPKEGPSLTVPVYLGHDLKALRVDGRVLPLSPDAGGVTRVTLGRDPILLYDIDTDLFDTLQTMRFEPSTVASSSGPQKVKLEFKNCFDSPLALSAISVQFPPYWEPTSLRIAEVPPDGKASIEVPIQVPESQILDTAPVTISLSFKAGREYHGLQVGLGLGVASETGVKVDVAPRWNGDVLDVEVKVDNPNRAGRFVVSIGMGEGYPVLTDSTGTIPAGETRTFVYHFPASDALVGRTIRVKLNEAQATTFLSKSATVPPRQ